MSTTEISARDPVAAATPNRQRRNAFRRIKTHLRTRTWPTPELERELLMDIAATAPSRRTKRVLDVTMASLALVLALPLMALIWAAIRLDSSGPVLFRQERVGMYREPFRCLKFRTMHEGSDQSGSWTMANDPRVTRVGRVLRKLRLDELPQLFNVLRGEMSMVGPRPFRLVLVEQVAQIMPFYDARFLEKPGLTGLAQVTCKMAETLEEQAEKFKWELRYLEQRSLWLDLTILVRTIAVVSGGKGH